MRPWLQRVTLLRLLAKEFPRSISSKRASSPGTYFRDRGGLRCSIIRDGARRRLFSSASGESKSSGTIQTDASSELSVQGTDSESDSEGLSEFEETRQQKKQLEGGIELIDIQDVEDQIKGQVSKLKELKGSMTDTEMEDIDIEMEDIDIEQYMTLGLKAEQDFRTSGNLPDPDSAKDPIRKRQLQVIRDIIISDPEYWTTLSASEKEEAEAEFLTKIRSSNGSHDTSKKYFETSLGMENYSDQSETEVDVPVSVSTCHIDSFYDFSVSS